MDRNFGMEIVRATETAALITARYQGLGQPYFILNKARELMLKNLDRVAIAGTIKNDRFIGNEKVNPLPETVGGGGEEADIMMASIEGHKICARGANNASSYLAIASKGGLLSVPNLYMNKIAVGPRASDVVDLNQSPTVNIKRVARALKKYIENITVCILERERHKGLIKEVQQCGARIKLIPDGDISAAIATIMEDKVDILMGYGGSPEGVITAAAMKCVGGDFVGKIRYENDRDREMACVLGIEDFEKIYTVDDLVLTDKVAFAATGVTDGEFLQGVQFFPDGAKTNSFVTRGETRTFRNLQSRHYFDSKNVDLF